MIDKYTAHLSGTSYWTSTDPRLVKVLEDARDSRVRLKVTYKDGSVEFGRIGRSTGTIKVPLLIHNKRSMGGGEILTTYVAEVSTSSGGTLLYRAVP